MSRSLNVCQIKSSEVASSNSVVYSAVFELHATKDCTEVRNVHPWSNVSDF